MPGTAGMLQSNPATVPASSGVANSIDRAKAGMPTTERQHNWNKGYLQQQAHKDLKILFSYPRIFIRHRLPDSKFISRLAESRIRFSITDISAYTKPKSERLERYCKWLMRNRFLQNPRKSASLPFPLISRSLHSIIYILKTISCDE